MSDESSPGYRVHEQEVIVRRAGVLAVVPVLLLGCILDVFCDKFHFFAQVGFGLKNKEKNCEKKYMKKRPLLQYANLYFDYKIFKGNKKVGEKKPRRNGET